MKSIKIIVCGKVQGVFYRASARDTARQLGIKGYVRNEPDGSVRILAQGGEEELEKFVTWCRKGPPRAQVENVLTEVNDLMNFTSFEIRR
jgi:acylphosphatase